MEGPRSAAAVSGNKLDCLHEMSRRTSTNVGATALSDTQISVPDALSGSMRVSSGSISSVGSSNSESMHILEVDTQRKNTALSRLRNNLTTKKKEYYSITLLTVTTILLYADQNLLAPNLTAIAREFNFTDEERDSKLGGELALAFFLLGAPVSLLVGCMTDTTNHRSLLLAFVIMGGESACFLSYFTTTYNQLYYCRAVTGLSLGGSMPLLYSILGDLFAAHERHLVSAVIGLGSGFGIGIGQNIAGWFGYGERWRMPFLYVSIPALICACTIATTMTDPPRGSMEAANRDDDISDDITDFNTNDVTDNYNNKQAPPALLSSTSYNPLEVDEEENMLPDSVRHAALGTRSVLQLIYAELKAYYGKFRILVRTPTFLLSLLQGAPGCLPWSIMNTFLCDYLSDNRGMSTPYATTVITLFGVGTVFGQVLLGGYVGGLLYLRDRRWPPLFAGIAALLGCFPTFLLFNHVSNTTPIILVTAICISMGVCVAATGPIVKATLTNVTQPEHRGQAFALFNTFDDVGKGFGAVIVALLIRRFGNRTDAFNASLCGWVICGIMNICMVCFVVQDENNVQASIAAARHNVEMARNSQESEYHDNIEHPSLQTIT